MGAGGGRTTGLRDNSSTFDSMSPQKVGTVCAAAVGDSRDSWARVRRELVSDYRSIARWVSPIT